jgi:hypothetical protein
LSFDASALSLPHVIYIRGRPAGVAILTGVIAADGLSHLLAAYDSVVPTPDDWPAALLKLLIGCVLLLKARRFWILHPRAWFGVVMVILIGSATNAIEILRGHAGIATYATLILAVLSLAYLADPRIRALFVQRVS